MAQAHDEIKRRRRAVRERIPEGEMRNVTFRVGSRAYNMLVDASNSSGVSISEFGETLIEQMLGKKAEKDRLQSGLRPLSKEEKDNLCPESRRILETIALVLANYEREKKWTEFEPGRIGANFAIRAVLDRGMPVPKDLYHANEKGNSYLQGAAVMGTQLGSIMWNPTDLASYNAYGSDYPTPEKGE